MNVAVIKERANNADVIASSKYHKYSLVADAKAFRLSRTAKNQKDFKVESMYHWKGDNDYAVLVCPYFQYPQNKSQIYGQALDNNISLFSWEYFVLILESNIKGTENVNLCHFWKNQILKIKQYTRNEAVTNLISALKINEKILSIQRFSNLLLE